MEKITYDNIKKLPSSKIVEISNNHQISIEDILSQEFWGKSYTMLDRQIKKEIEDYLLEPQEKNLFYHEFLKTHLISINKMLEELNIKIKKATGFYKNKIFNIYDLILAQNEIKDIQELDKTDIKKIGDYLVNVIGCEEYDDYIGLKTSIYKKAEDVESIDKDIYKVIAEYNLGTLENNNKTLLEKYNAEYNLNFLELITPKIKTRIKARH